jgi:uncharacterized protein YndB with AHSA1/START domain
MSKTVITAEPGMPQIIVTREFGAARDLVFRAYTEPELLTQWLGPRDLVLTVERYDIRDGGRWRYVHTDRAGHDYGFHGVFHGDPSPQAIVQTFEFEGAPGHVKLDSTTLEQRGGTTLVRTVSAFTSVADRDAMVASGMERGARDSAERLEELLATLQDPAAGARSGGPGDVPAGRPEVLDRLDVLIGRWETEARFEAGRFGPGSPAQTSGGGRTDFEWLEGRYFLAQRFVAVHPAAPSGIAIIGAGPDPAMCTQHYYDSRGVARIYQMSLNGRVWKLWREAPGFWQRYTGLVSDDGSTITGAWETSADGQEWKHDFGLTYIKAGTS